MATPWFSSNFRPVILSSLDGSESAVAMRVAKCGPWFSLPPELQMQGPSDFLEVRAEVGKNPVCALAPLLRLRGERRAPALPGLPTVAVQRLGALARGWPPLPP